MSRKALVVTDTALAHVDGDPAGEVGEPVEVIVRWRGHAMDALEELTAVLLPVARVGHELIVVAGEQR